MPQRVNIKSDIGTSKIASDSYDTNNIFLTDQGWVYRHYKGNPATTTRFWDEILVAGQTDPDNATAVSADITVTPYAPDGGEGNTPYVPVSFEVGGGTPDDVYDIEYSKHMENDVEFGDPANYEPANLVDADGNVIPPGLPQFPVVDGYETPGVTP